MKKWLKRLLIAYLVAVFGRIVLFHFSLPYGIFCARWTEDNGANYCSAEIFSYRSYGRDVMKNLFDRILNPFGIYGWSCTQRGGFLDKGMSGYKENQCYYYIWEINK